MTKTHYSRRRKKPASLRVMLAFLAPALLVAAGFAAAGGAFGYGAYQEEHDPFCASCHTQPESTFFQRSTAPQAVDLASAHTAQKVHCIDCHSGAGTLGRVSAEMMGAHNAYLYFTRQAVQPAPLTHPIADENCLKCHDQVTTQQTMNNHFHVFLSRWQAAVPNAGTCVSCHAGHSTDGSADLMYLNEQQTQLVCDACHRVLRGN
jgi:predicted CXXCH cytochrome family protein